MSKGTFGAKQLNQLFNKAHKSQLKTDQILTDFEKNLGLRLMKFKEANADKDNDDDDPEVDAQYFENEMKNEFGQLKKKFKGIVDGIRDNDFSLFVKANEGKAKAN